MPRGTGVIQKIARGGLLVVLCATAGYGQSVAGSIVGSVADTGGSVIPNVSLKLILETTGATRESATDEIGNFVFNVLQPGVYTLAVEHSGFKKYERKGITLPANERLSVGQITLELGALTETVTVTAQGATVQVASAERSGIISSAQMQNLTVLSRDFTILLSMLPGVVTNPRGETPGFGGSATFNIQGLRTNTNDTKIDGLPGQDLGNANDVTAFISMDTIAEVKILVSNYQAEFGRKPGASIQAVTKSGTREFHGALYWYKRHEQFNANNFFNNRQDIREPRYRYTTAGYNAGGPVFIPGKFNRDRDKLFFFFSQEFLREARPQPIRQLTMPTQAERRGDFSDSRDLNGALIPIRDPEANAPFPNNVVPSSRINVLTQRYLSLLPLPNFFDIGLSARRYNFQTQESMVAPKHSETIRVDYNLTQNTSVYGRFSNFWEDIRGWAVPGGNGNWGWLPNTYKDTSRTFVLSATHIFDPTLVLELSTGVLRATEDGPAQKQEDVDRLNRVKSGVTIPQFFPENNPLNLVPRASFGGITNAPSITYENRFPLRGSDTMFTWSGGLTKTYGTHILKAGLWVERARNFEEKDGIFAGDFSFGRDVNNPNDANYAYANALLGNFASYLESTTRPWEQGRSTLMEWFAQDNWKARKGVTLDYGVRFSWVQPYHSYRREEAGFTPDRWDPAKTVKLIEAAIAGNRRVGRHPVTGAVYPAAAIGALAPGVGDPVNGTVNALLDQNYPQGLREDSGVKVAPRFGFSWDLSGDGKTAIRGGIGLFYNAREQGSRGWGTWRNPPMRAEPVIYYGNVDTFINSTGVTFPAGTTGHTRVWPVARVMSYSFGIQRDLGFGTVLDVSYVASLGRHLPQGRNLNSIPFGSNFQRANEDPTNPGRPLPAAFLRPYLGYNDIVLYEYVSNSSYHSLQATANRRFARGIQYGFAYTWSKAMDYVDSDTGTVSNLIDPKVWNYGKGGFDRTHMLTIYGMWNIPGLSPVWKNPVARFVFDDWQLSGIGNFQSGAPSGIGLGFVTAIDITGSPTDGARTVMVANPIIPKSERNFSRNFNTGAFAPPAVGTFGNAAKDVIRGPGINNWNVSLFKNIPFYQERVRMQFRAEFYNAFNHTQFSGLDTSTRFDAQGRQVNARFGEFTSARAARHIQLALRLHF